MVLSSPDVTCPMHDLFTSFVRSPSNYYSVTILETVHILLNLHYCICRTRDLPVYIGGLVVNNFLRSKDTPAKTHHFNWVELKKS